MATTEIQKVPGTFNLPTDWPRLIFPDTTTGLIADWRADLLPVGTLASTGWKSATGAAGVLTADGSLAQPTVKTDARGQKHLTMESTRMRSTVNWAGDITILAVVRPTLTAGQVSRIASGGGDGYRSLNTSNSDKFSIATNKSSATGSTIPNVASGALTAVIGRYGATELDGLQYGGSWSTPAVATGHPTQSVLFVGGNSSGDATAFLRGDLYRLQVWNRILTKTDAEAALQTMANTYGI